MIPLKRGLLTNAGKNLHICLSSCLFSGTRSLRLSIVPYRGVMPLWHNFLERKKYRRRHREIIYRGNMRISEHFTSVLLAQLCLKLRLITRDSVRSIRISAKGGSLSITISVIRLRVDFRVSREERDSSIFAGTR